MEAWLQAIFGTAALVSLGIFFTLATRRDGSADTPDNRSRRGMRYTVAIIMLGGLAVFYLSLSLSTALGWSRSTGAAVVLLPSMLILIVVSIVVGLRIQRGPAPTASDRPGSPPDHP